MKIISAQQTREADTFTIKQQAITSTDLMERAANACVKSILHQSEALTEFTVFCGKGNNGGDGLAIARLLASANRKVEVYIVNHTEKESVDFSVNLKRLQEQKFVSVQYINKVGDLKPITNPNHIIIDALLGTGINKAVAGLLADVIAFINELHLFVIAIDAPSGLFCDERPTHKNIIHANITLTFQRPKFTFLFADFYEYVGNFEILDIGLDEPFIEAQASKYYYTTSYAIDKLLVPRTKFTNKGTYGHALLLAGSKGKIGAAILSAKACLRSGVGLLSVCLPACGYTAMQTALPEAMVLTDTDDDYLTACPDLSTYAAVGMGPGIGREKQTAQALKVLIQQTNVPLVLDADALNMLSENKTWLSFLPSNTILTPHPKEFDRLTYTHTNAFERLQTCKEFALKNNIIVVLKGAHTAVVLPNGQVFFNSTGNAALAKGGSGDVLTGMILALLANGYSEEEAAIMAVYLHGLAADKYIKTYKPESMLASDLIDMLKEVY
jgi:NAD(P)H-hydrate epimerase